MMSDLLNSNQILHKGKPHQIQEDMAASGAATRLPLYFVHSSHHVSHHVPEYVYLNQINPISNAAPSQTATGCSTTHTASHVPLPHQSSYSVSYFLRRMSQHYLLHKGALAEVHQRPKPTHSPTTAMTMGPITTKAPSRYTMAGASAAS
jgi:hypothetical protein